MLVALTLAGLILLAQYPLWLGKGGWLRVWDVERQIRAQLGDGRALASRLAVGLDPAHGRPDVEVQDEGEDADQRPAPEAIPADPRTAIHA